MFSGRATARRYYWGFLILLLSLTLNQGEGAGVEGIGARLGVAHDGEGGQPPLRWNGIESQNPATVEGDGGRGSGAGELVALPPGGDRVRVGHYLRGTRP